MEWFTVVSIVKALLYKDHNNKLRTTKRKPINRFMKLNVHQVSVQFIPYYLKSNELKNTK